MPQSATLESTTAPVTIPAPRTEQPVDPNAWVLTLPHDDLTLALSLSDLPQHPTTQERILGGYINDDRPTGTRAVLNPAGVRQLTAWVVQGIHRATLDNDTARCLVALWKATHEYRSHSARGTWNTPRGKAFAGLFGSPRRTQHAADWVGDLPTMHLPITVRVQHTVDTTDMVFTLGRLFTNVSELDHLSLSTMTASYRMSRHDANMAAAYFDRTLVRHERGGYALV